MTTNEYKEMSEQYLLHTYNRYPIVLEKGEDVYLFDTDGNKYLDFAAAMSAEKLAFLSDIEGVFYDINDSSSLISELGVSEAQKLIEDGIVAGGMIPKLQNCISAIENGVSRVHILDGRIPHCLLLEIYTNKGIGTAILGDEEEKFDNDNK